MRKILVTGADGQLGTALKEAAGEGEWLFTDLAELDVRNYDAVMAYFDRHEPDFVINCAAYNDVDRAETDREAAFRANSDAPRFLAEASSNHGSAFIHISTDYVFRGNVDQPYTEDDIPSPVNVYGFTKMSGVRTMFETGCRGAVIRTSWLYSPWGHNFVKSILAAAEKNDRISVVSDQTSRPTSATAFAAALVKMIPVMAEWPDKPAEFYHFCDAGFASRVEFATEIIRQAGLNCRVIPVTSAQYGSPALRPIYSVMDISKIGRDFGIFPRPWQEEVADCLARIRKS
ncbi:MAG: dTDP-4-dehydrorhamnose reductase [Alistipes sp.]|jgi:dTDP-4-dehydrorhamnose reductase|nr:dTDP-4-dehydrorhamnose reductase [Alistipes sp.]